MFNLIRRISSSFLPRPDRPWNDDATSTAPQIGQKRRRDSVEVEDEIAESSSTSKKLRREDTEIAIDSRISESPVREGKETEGVKEVTEGVRDVELEDIKEETVEALSEAAAVPLPDSPALEAQADTADVKAVAEESSPIDSTDSVESPEAAKEESEGEATVVDAEEPANEAISKAVEAANTLPTVAELPQKEAEVKATEADSLVEQPSQSLEKESPSDIHTEVVEAVAA